MCFAVDKSSNRNCLVLPRGNVGNTLVLYFLLSSAMPFILQNLRVQISHAIVLIGALLYIASFSNHVQAQASPLSSSKGVSPTADQFSSFELAMDKVADQYGSDHRQVLIQLGKIEKQSKDLKDFATLSAYRCYLTSELKQVTEYQAIVQDLKSKVVDEATKLAVQAAIELCQMYGEGDRQKRDQALARAFHFVKDAKAATLRYWISTMYADQTTLQGRAREAMDAAKIARNVAKANNDDFRQATSLRTLAMVEVDFGDKEEALVYIDEVVALRKKISSDPIDTESLLNRAFILAALKRYDEALKAYREVEMIAVKQKEVSIPPIVWSNYADIAYARGDFNQAQKEVDRLLRWSQEHQDVYLTSYAKMTAALLAVESKNPDLAQQLFKEAATFFEKENRRVEMRDFYGALAKAYTRNGYHKQAYVALEQKMNLSTSIEQESRGHAANELRELLKTEERIKENISLQAEVERSRLSLQRWVFLALLLLLALVWAARLFIQSRRRNSVLQLENKELDIQRFQDPLTQLFNRRYVMEKRNAIWQKIQNQSAAILIIDADHFKKINDNFGHPAGDAALIEIARRVQLNVRDSDIVVRWGGEEFLICSFACNAAQAGLMATRILAELRSTPMEFDGKLIQLSASIGYVLIPLQWRANMQLSFDESIKFADAALYLAKAKGRNRAIGLEKMISPAREYAQLFDQLEDAATKGEIQLKEIIGADFP